jgi:hypothetical protein
MEKESSALNRRSFLDYFLGSGVVALLGSVFFPVLKYIMPPAIPQAVQNDVVAGKVGELANAGRFSVWQQAGNSRAHARGRLSRLLCRVYALAVHRAISR